VLPESRDLLPQFVVLLGRQARTLSDDASSRLSVWHTADHRATAGARSMKYAQLDSANRSVAARDELGVERTALGGREAPRSSARFLTPRTTVATPGTEIA
jgi:hypothetical protein